MSAHAVLLSCNWISVADVKEVQGEWHGDWSVHRLLCVLELLRAGFGSSWQGSDGHTVDRYRSR